eukprot:CAMPEP_0113681390 /NCGR_PEP_ID=MMETSP0038_2-20120614/11968_1 /TAXON_ID=2898 /ORGANISM="Cryptomonas paramecium" /LENGTH=244 /DNA_ID=CAMNT_0000600117 /DNA_START=19 /DNA_END=753 /DNA_ORIENTATION=+ /assembly_acc=CAM_ASM_000170
MSNPTPAQCTVIEEVGSTGVGALALGFIILAVATVIFLSKAWNAGEHKSYYLATSYLSGIGTIVYFAMLSGEGWTTVTGCRQFFWVRNAGWFVTQPLVVLLLGLVAQSDNASIAAGMGAVAIFNVATYFGAVADVQSVKWIWLLIGVVGLVGALVAVTRTFKSAVQLRGSLEIEQLYGRLATLASFALAAYPLVWLFAVGFGGFSVSFEVCAYAVLDVLLQAVAGFVVVGAQATLASGAPKEFV